MSDFAEKRDFQRMTLDCELSFFKPGNSQHFIGQVINLSSKGILFTSSESFDVDTVLEIVVTPSNSLTSPMEASVLVSRVTDNQSIFEIACEILDIHKEKTGN
ncbi:MAG: PilZ domain-containing protein [Gammaproteobacteria bacterium]|nr:PilZ domain-containing protein [Gammaproteobacteria bacterium]